MPEFGALLLDNDPRILEDHGVLRFVRIEREDPHQHGYTVCTTWYDRPGGADKARRGVRIRTDRLFSASRSGYRTAEVKPVHGSPA